MSLRRFVKLLLKEHKGEEMFVSEIQAYLSSLINLTNTNVRRKYNYIFLSNKYG